MKKIILPLLLICSVSVTAQTKADSTKYWKFKGLGNLNFSQIQLENWSAGGKSSLSASATTNFTLSFKKAKNSWKNTLDLAYGLIDQQQTTPALTKSDDKIDFNSQYSIKASKKWDYSTLFNFKTQFSPGYSYPDDSTVISDFMSPGYFMLSLGMDYKPSDWFSVLLAPAAGRLTVVTRKALSDSGAFGVKPGETVKEEFGGYVKIAIDKEVVKNVTLKSSVGFFSNYLDHPGNIVIDGQATVFFKVNKFINASINTQFIYDNAVKLPIYKSDHTTVDHYGPRLQFKEVFGLGLSYGF